MTDLIYRCVAEWASSLPRLSPVLEIGSTYVNGSVRPIFEGPGVNYTGIDQAPGPMVDEVMSAHDLYYPRESFPLVLCLEVLEHDPKFWLTLAEIRRVLSPGGYVIISVPYNGFHEHKYPVDCFRFLEDAVSTVLLEGLQVIHSAVLHGDPGGPTLICMGRKPL